MSKATGASMSAKRQSVDAGVRFVLRKRNGVVFCDRVEVGTKAAPISEPLKLSGEKPCECEVRLLLEMWLCQHG